MTNLQEAALENYFLIRLKYNEDRTYHAFYHPTIYHLRHFEFNQEILSSLFIIFSMRQRVTEKCSSHYWPCRGLNKCDIHHVMYLLFSSCRGTNDEFSGKMLRELPSQSNYGLGRQWGSQGNNIHNITFFTSQWLMIACLRTSFTQHNQYILRRPREKTACGYEKCDGKKTLKTFLSILSKFLVTLILLHPILFLLPAK